MERLQSHQDKLSRWLSADTDHILNECGDILCFNEYKNIKKQSSEEQKMSFLLRTIINKGGGTCETFMEILRKNQGRYHQLQQFFTSNVSAAPTVFADGDSVVSHTRLTNVKARSLTYNVEIRTNPRGSSSGNSVPAADYTATAGSVILADRISGINVGDIKCSVNIKPPRVPSAPGESADLLHQNAAGKMIVERKVKLIECLMADHGYILQHVHQKSIITQRDYQNLRSYSKPEDAVTKLIDLVLGKDPEICLQFLQLLKKPQVLETFPLLGDILDIEALSQWK